MFLYLDITQPLHVIGDSVQATELVEMCEQDLRLNHGTAVPVITVPHDMVCDLSPGSQCVLGFSNPTYRARMLDLYRARFSWPTIVDDRATVGPSCKIGSGCIIYANSLMLHAVNMGDFNVLSPMSYLSHGCSTGSNVVFTPGVVVGGSTTIGHNVYFGQGSSIKDKISIGSKMLFGMNSVVSKSISEPGSYLGHRRTEIQL